MPQDPMVGQLAAGGPENAALGARFAVIRLG